MGKEMAIYTKRIMNWDPKSDYKVLATMEKEFEAKDPSFFNEVLKKEPTLVIRVHAVTVLSEIGDESSVPVLADVMKNALQIGAKIHTLGVAENINST